MSEGISTIALSGGVGGAKLALGLCHAMPPEELLVVANTGDDFEHFGLTICPDIDTLTYTLAGLNNQEMGWGRVGETDTFMKTLATLGGETWFFLGDGDLALHVERTRRLNSGEALSAITADVARRWGIAAHIAPMSDHPVRTIVETPTGPLAFQHYFVRDKCKPEVTGFRFDRAEDAQANGDFLAAVTSPELGAIVICPSNPFISIEPIFSVPGVRDALTTRQVPLIAISPIVGGQAIKGPTAKMMRELGMPTTAAAVAAHYGDLLDGFVVDNADAAAADAIAETGVEVRVTNTVMQSLEDRVALARDVLAFARQLSGTHSTARASTPLEV